MKKILILGTVCALTVSGYAQGLISINGGAANKISVNNGTSTVQMPAVAGAYIFDVLQWTGVGTPTINGNSSFLSASWVDTGVLGGTGTGPKAGQVSGALTASAANWAPGVTSFDVVVGWSSTEGANWATVLASITSGVWADTSTAGAFGWSSVGSTTSATSPAPGNSVWSTIPTGFVLFNSNVAPVPEPATIALAGLGGLALLALRRKK